MTSSNPDDPRVTKLSKLFNDVIYERRKLISSRDGNLFIEAFPSGLPALRASVMFDTSASFMNDSAGPLLRYLQAPSLGAVDSGSVLARILLNMVEPPFFWDAFTKAFKDGALGVSAVYSYAWLLLQLVCLPGKASKPYVSLANGPAFLDLILTCSDGETRNLGQKIKHILPLDASELGIDADAKPGGRHDNDYPDYKAISIMPTADELLSKDRPFFRSADFLEDPNLETSRRPLHLDNQFRLLREDMLGEIREEMKVFTGAKSGHHKGLILENLSLNRLEMGTDRKRLPWGIVLQYKEGLPQLRRLKPEQRKKFLINNRQILRQGNMACLLIDNQPVAFPTIHRDEEEMAQIPANVVVQFADDPTLSCALLKMKNTRNIKLVQLDAAIFAFEPFLRRLQDMSGFPLAEEILHWQEGQDLKASVFKPESVLQELESRQGKELKDILKVKKSVILDESQMKSLSASLLQRVSLVQGPPGTGKSFIGALVAKVLHDSTKQVILVVCYTNHALDQFLEDLMDIGIPQASIVRLGGKSTDRTKPLTIREQSGSKLTPSHWRDIDKIKQNLLELETKMRESFGRYRSMNVQKGHIMDYLEFLSEGPPFFDAFTVPAPNADGMTRVGRRGKVMNTFYLLDRWIRGATDAGSLQHIQPKGAATVWKMAPGARQATLYEWRNTILADLVTEIKDKGRRYNVDQARLNSILGEKDKDIIRSKRVIACTTNGAAKFSSAIQSASPGVVLVEEAGEIMEAHIITSLGPRTEQLIMIGDHKQLRPKCSYGLSVEQGDGFDLNRSLFERLVLKGFPHITLTQQHRMRPQISSMIRHLTYPELRDAKSTLNRPHLRGFRDDVIFINHSHPEVELKNTKEQRDAKQSSKQNEFEGQMILKCVRYLAQQGYGSDNLVVLTPYLGQLKLLRDQLAQENDPILNDMDKFDLIRAGLLTDVGSRTSKPSLKISTIDNYQGEESDIVLVSLTRSNKSKDIGFMAAPERLNVLLSRARDALILIGNSDTFINARKGRQLWQKFFDLLKENDHVYEGSPVKCEKHPDRTATLSSPSDFEQRCPDGGCEEPCGVFLKCGIHKCPQRCHQLLDHSKILCQSVMKQDCSIGHRQMWKCHVGTPLVCLTCKHESEQAQEKAQKALRKKQERDESLQKHLKEMSKLDADIEQINEDMKHGRENSELQNSLAQKRKDLQAARERQKTANNLPQGDPRNVHNGEVAQTATKAVPTSPRPSKPSSDKHKDIREHIKSAIGHNQSASKVEWQRQKDQENASNPAIDKVMDMIGLEEVKSQVLGIKGKVETSIRQGTDLKKERLGLVLVGNPGTGKTTVARYYAEILTSLQALPGDGFVETTGSRLAHEGITEVKKHLKELEKPDGGVYFIDEAYQLTEGHNYGGKAVLDFLLAEIESLTGKVAFVFAGYRKQMEKFFEHNQGFRSRIPLKLHFEDYSDEELLSMLAFKMNHYYKHGIQIEGGVDGLYMRIAIRRLGRGRGREGFGNARALENIFSRVRERQSDRLAKERRAGLGPDDLVITKEDLIGPDPSEAILTCKSWERLQSLTGLKSVKTSVSVLIDLIKTNYERELREQPLVEMPLNRVFLGSPGTGKTTVAKLYGQILAAIGLLSNGEVVTKNPADFIGSVMGQSEANTKAILESTVGKVLIIDEAYMLYSGSADGASNADMYRTAVIDTMVAEVQSVPGEDRCVLLLGYEPQMVEMFQNVNPGLTRRFQLQDAFHFEDFNDSELKEILSQKLKTHGLSATGDAVTTAIDVLSRARNGLNFGNAGDVENLISRAKSSYQARQSTLPTTQRSIDFLFEAQDFDPDHDRASGAETNLHELFKDVIGCESIISKLDGFLQAAKGMRIRGLDPRESIPMNFIFKGPPGTGKTTTARKVGQVYYDLGFLSQVEVVECSASDLVGQYVGQTGPKTIKQLERGLGKVLFIDEAYRLGEGTFAQEAINELVDTMTKPKFAGKMVIILAGYDNDMNNLLRVNEGLSSRFADEIVFPPLSAGNCLGLLQARLKQREIAVSSLGELLEPMTELSQLPSWGNARDVQTLAKSMVREVYRNNSDNSAQLNLSPEIALDCIQNMLSDRRKRAKSTCLPSRSSLAEHDQQLPPERSFQPAPRANSSTATRTESAPLAMGEEEEQQTDPAPAPAPILESETSDPLPRDPGVSDAIWSQLQKDKAQADLIVRQNQKVICEQEESHRLALEAEKKAEQAVSDLERDQQNKQITQAHKADIAAAEAQAQLYQSLLKEREEARIKAAKAKMELEHRRRREAERQEKERKIQQKLTQMGICPAGFRWIPQAGGYRCGGGTHWVDGSQLGV